MSFGYFVQGIAQGVQIGMQYELSKMNALAYQKQIKIQEDTLAFNKEKFASEEKLKQAKLDALTAGKQAGTITDNPMSTKLQFDKNLEYLKNNVSVLLTGDEAQQKEYLSKRDEIGKLINVTDTEGKQVVTFEQAKGAQSFINNPYESALIQQYNTFQNTDKDIEAQALYNRMKDKKKAQKDFRLSEEGYNNVMSAMNKGLSLEQNTNEISQEGWFDSVRVNPKTGKPDIDNATIDKKVSEISSMFQQGKISDSYAKQKLTQLKTWSIEKDKDKFTKGKNQTAGKFIFDNLNNFVNDPSEKYDLKLEIYRALGEQDISPDDTSFNGKKLANDFSIGVISNYYKNNYSQYIQNTKELNSIEGLKLIKQRVKKGKAINKAKQVLGIIGTPGQPIMMNSYVQ